MNNKGFTLVELVIGIGIISAFIGALLVIFTASHFIIKFW